MRVRPRMVFATQARPLRLHLRDKCLHGQGSIGRRPKIPWAFEWFADEQTLSESEITGERFKHMLPGSNSPGVADLQHSIGGRGTYQIRHQPILRPVATPNHIASAPRRHVWSDRKSTR